MQSDMQSNEPSTHPEDGAAQRGETERLRLYDRTVASEKDFVRQHADAIHNPLFVPTSFEDLRTHDVYKTFASWQTDTLGVVAMSILATLAVVLLFYTLHRLTSLGVVGWIRLASMVMTIVTIFSWTKQTFV
jgi:hypothetical protein